MNQNMAHTSPSRLLDEFKQDTADQKVRYALYLLSELAKVIGNSDEFKYQGV